MSGHFRWTDEQMEGLRPFFPKSFGKSLVDGRRVLSGIIHIKKNGLQWKDAPSYYGPPNVHLTFLTNEGHDGFDGSTAHVSVAQMRALGVVVDAPSVEIGLELP